MDPLQSKVFQTQERIVAFRQKSDAHEGVIRRMRAAVDAKRRENEKEAEKMEANIRKEEAKLQELEHEGAALQRELAAAQARVSQRAVRKAAA